MTPERWQRIRSVLDEVEAVGAGERATAVARLCGGDAGLAAEVLALLGEEGGDVWIRDVIATNAAAEVTARAARGQVWRDAVETLRMRNPETVRVLEMRHVEGKELCAIAEGLGIPVERVRSQLALGEAFLRRALAGQ